MRSSNAIEDVLRGPARASTLARLAIPGRVRRARFHLLLPWFFPAAILALWLVAASRRWVAPQILPPPAVVLDTLLSMLRSGELWGNLRPSLVRVAYGFAIAAGLGVAGGAFLGLCRTASDVVTPVFRAYAQIPVIAWVPVGLLLLGIEERLLVTLIASAAVVPVLASTYEGVRGVSPQILEVGRVYGYRGVKLFVKVVAPATVPPVFAGLRYGFSQAWLTLIAAELVGTTEGMGYMMYEARELFQLDVVLAAIAVLGATGVLLDGALSLVESRLLVWRPRGF